MSNGGGTTYHADIEGLRLFAYQHVGWWSAAVYDLKLHKFVSEREPLPPHQDSERDAKNEALLMAVAYLRKSPDEVEPPDWQSGKPKPSQKRSTMTLDYTDVFAKWPKEEDRATRAFYEETGADGVRVFPVALAYFKQPWEACVAVFYLVNRSKEEEVFSDWALEAPKDWEPQKPLLPSPKPDDLTASKIAWLVPPFHRVGAGRASKVAVFYKDPHWLSAWIADNRPAQFPTCTIQVKTSRHSESKHSMEVLRGSWFEDGRG